MRVELMIERCAVGSAIVLSSWLGSPCGRRPCRVRREELETSPFTSRAERGDPSPIPSPVDGRTTSSM